MRCPTCGQPVNPERSSTMPFCSERCQQIDLARWLDERYSVPVMPDPDEEEAPPDAEPDDSMLE